MANFFVRIWLSAAHCEASRFPIGTCGHDSNMLISFVSASSGSMDAILTTGLACRYSGGCNSGSRWQICPARGKLFNVRWDFRQVAIEGLTFL
jgi:hypothetical protein